MRLTLLFLSTIIVSIIRMWPLRYYGKSKNPLYDDALCAVFSPLELNVGIIAMCMISVRRFFQLYLSRCFPSDSAAQRNRKYYRYDADFGKGGVRRVDTLDGSLFLTTFEVRVTFLFSCRDKCNQMNQC